MLFTMPRAKLIDLLRGTDSMGAYRALLLAKSEEQLLEEQVGNLGKLLRILKTSNPYYSKLLSKVSDVDITQHPVAVLQGLPIVDKSVVERHREQWRGRIPGRRQHPKHSGGSTGAPFCYWVDGDYVSLLWARIYWAWHRYAGYEPGMQYVTVAGKSLRTVTSARGLKELLYHRLQNNLFVHGDHVRPGMQVDKFRLARAVLVYGYPSSLCALISANPEFPTLCKQIRGVFTTSEQLLPQQRAMLEAAFGVAVFDMYGANDGGVLSCECERHCGYHYNMEHCYVETLRNESAQEELLLTNLTSFSFPLVRYRVGDIGEVDKSQCGCGLESYRIVRLGGRTRDLVKLPDGSAVHGSRLNKIISGVPAAAFVRIVQAADYGVTVHLATRDELAFAGAAEHLRRRLSEVLPGLKVQVRETSVPLAGENKLKVIESHVR